MELYKKSSDTISIEEILGEDGGILAYEVFVNSTRDSEYKSLFDAQDRLEELSWEYIKDSTVDDFAKDVIENIGGGSTISVTSNTISTSNGAAFKLV